MEITLIIMMLLGVIGSLYVGFQRGYEQSEAKHAKAMKPVKPEPSGYYFELYSSKERAQKVWRFRLKSANHETVASSEAYTTKANAKKTIAAIIENTLGASIVEKKK